jgi:hypothetical protein
MRRLGVIRPSNLDAGFHEGRMARTPSGETWSGRKSPLADGGTPDDDA